MFVIRITTHHNYRLDRVIQYRMAVGAIISIDQEVSIACHYIRHWRGTCV